MVELMQRLSLEPTTVTIDRSWDVSCWGIGDFYDGDHVLRGDKDDFRIVFGYVEEELLSAKPFEVLVIPGLNGWSRYTRKTRDAILRRVSEGAGLVLLHPFVGDVKGHPFRGDEPEGDERIWEISPLVGVPTTGSATAATRSRTRRPSSRVSGGRGRTRSPRVSTWRCCPRARAAADSTATRRRATSRSRPPATRWSPPARTARAAWWPSPPWAMASSRGH